MRTVKRAIAVTFLIAILFAFAGCFGSKDSGGKKYSWDGYEFEVQKTELTEKDDKKYVTVSLEMDKEGMPQKTFKEFAQKGYIKFNDVKPQMIFKYKQNKQGKITYAEVSFKMPDDYEFNEDDLEIKE